VYFLFLNKRAQWPSINRGNKSKILDFVVYSLSSELIVPEILNLRSFALGLIGKELIFSGSEVTEVTEVTEVEHKLNRVYFENFNKLHQKLIIEVKVL
jgi:hypothetical protein